MMSNAEEVHYKAVIAADNQEPPKDYCISAYADHFNGFVEGYIEGYHQAEKDNELTWEDMECIIKHYQDIMAEKSRVFVRVEDYKELLKRYKDYKERKEK